MIDTFTLIVNYTDSHGNRVNRKFENISRVAVNTYKDYFFYDTDHADICWDVIEFNKKQGA